MECVCGRGRGEQLLGLVSPFLLASSFTAELGLKEKAVVLIWCLFNALGKDRQLSIEVRATGGGNPALNGTMGSGDMSTS